MSNDVRVTNKSNNNTTTTEKKKKCSYHHSKPGTLVPSATIVMAVIESLMWLIQPKCAAISPMTAVSKPMKKMDVTKAGQPLHLSEQRARKKTKPLVLLGRLVISLGKIECPEKVIPKISSLSSSAFLGVF